VRASSIGLGLVALVVVGGAGAVLVALKAPPTRVVAGTDVEVDAGIEAWCAEGLTPIEGGGCFAAPPARASLPALATPVPLLVYLHGRYSPKTLEEEHVRQARVARLGNAKGFGVLALRGVQGECTQEELADTWCWPSNPRNVDHGEAFFARMKPAMTAARTRLGAGGPNHLLGFSNGAYFAALIATRSFGPFDAIAIAHGGPVQPTRAAGTTPPLLLITADDDPSDGEMRQLDAELVREKWPHEFVGREGAHALLDWDVDIALTFFARAEKEKLPLAPPLQPPRPRVVKNEAGEDEPASAKPSAGEPSVAQGTPASDDGGENPYQAVAP
jgi:predicted esterase